MEHINHKEWSRIFGALRYFLGSSSIAASSYPCELVEDYWPRLSEGNKAGLARDIREFDGELYRSWQMLLAALETEKHRTIEAIDGTSHVCFKVDGVWFPIAEYIKNPYIETHFPTDKMKEVPGGKVEGE